MHNSTRCYFSVAVAIFTRSPAAFEALRSLKILQLPSRSSQESFIYANTQRPGVSCEYLCKEWKAYCAHKDKLLSENQLTPLAKGVLTFDEVKVQSGVSVCVCMCVCVHVWVCVQTYMYMFVHACLCVCLCL